MRISNIKDYQHITTPQITSIHGVPVEFVLNLIMHLIRYDRAANSITKGGPFNITRWIYNLTIATIPLHLETSNNMENDAETYIYISRLSGPDWSCITREQILTNEISRAILSFKMVNKDAFRRDMTILRMFGSKVGDWSDDG
jgi:hypothetical protein